MYGHIIGGAPDPDYRRGVLTADLAVGDTVLHVDDTSDFDEDAAIQTGRIMLGLDFDADGNFDLSAATIVPYSTCDEDDLTVTLLAPSTGTASDGDPVYVYDPATGVPAVDYTVWVELDGADPGGDALPVLLSFGLIDAIGDSTDLTGQAIEFDEDEDGELVATNISGSATSAGTVKAMQDALTVATLGDQILNLTYRPIKNSEHLYWNGVYQPGGQWSRDQWTVTIPDGAGFLVAGDELVMEYLYTDPTPKPTDVPGPGTYTVDIPGYVYSFDHAGATGVIVGGADSVGSEDGDTSYVEYDGGALTGGTAGYSVQVKFPATPLPATAVLNSTVLVVQAKGTDSRTGSAPYNTANSLPPSPGPSASATQRDPALYHTPPTFGFLADGFWTGIRGAESVGYVETLTPLKGHYVGGVLTDPTLEFVSKEMIEDGHVENNPDTGLVISDGFSGDSTNPGVPTVIRYSYVALRITYTIP